MVNGHIGYLAVTSERPNEVASFYKTYFGMRELGRSDAGDISITDGWINVSLLKQRSADDERGLSHFGVAVEDIREIEARLEEFAPNADLRPEPGDLHHGEYRVFDPNGMAVSVSVKNFGVAVSPNGSPRIRHVALSVPKGDDVLSFFVNVFGFREVSTSLRRREANHPVRFAGDGSINLAILADPETLMKLDEERELQAGQPGQLAINMKPGLAHFGFVVPDSLGLMERMPPELSGATNKRPDRRDMAEYRVFDPDHNGIDLSQEKGFEVDFDVWERAAS